MAVAAASCVDGNVLWFLGWLGPAPKQPGLLLLAQPVAVPLNVDGGSVVEQAVEDGGRQDLVVEDLPQSTKLLLLVTMRLARS